MRALRLVAPHRVEVCDAGQPEPGPGEVLVRVGASGACHSDLHLIDLPAEAALPLPLTLGHENAGWVAGLGAGVTGLEEGEPVAVYGADWCGRCVECLRGHENRCRVLPLGGIGISRDGGMAGHVAVPAGALVPIGDLDVVQAAPLTDAALTPYHAIRLSREALRPGATCVVIGIGGLGHMALQILAATCSVRVIAVDERPGALELARRLGADETVVSGPDTAAEIRELVGPAPGGVDAVLDFVGVDATLGVAGAVVAPGGRITMVGLGGGTLGMTPGVGPTPVPLEVEVVIPFWGTRSELVEVLALARTGGIRADVETFPLEDAPLAYERLRRGEVLGRAVVVPGA